MSKKVCSTCGQEIKKTPMQKHIYELETMRNYLRSAKQYSQEARNNIPYHTNEFKLLIAIEQLIHYSSYYLNKDLVKHGLATVKGSSQAQLEPQEQLRDHDCNICKLKE